MSAGSVGAALDAAGGKELVEAILRIPTSGVANQLDTMLAGVEPWRIVLGTATATLITYYLYNLTQHRVPLPARIKATFFKYVKKIPQVRERIEKETERAGKTFEDVLTESCKHIPYITQLPEDGLNDDDIISKIEKYLASSPLDWKKGAYSGTVYNFDDAKQVLLTKVFDKTAFTNPLHPDAFPGVRKIEAEIVRIGCNIFNGGPESCGVVTSGGTESIILACKAYRDMARERGVEFPEILCPITAHAAFDKAADMLGMSIKHVPLDESTMRVDVKAMRRMLSKRTAVLVGSAPQFAQGSIDPIEEIAELGVKYNIPVHVDACLGGFVLAFMEAAGYVTRPFDFRVPGVTSISADTHKYGYTPKGTSLVLYRDQSYRNHQWFIYPDWPGGIYATPTIAGSRSGATLAVTWATLLSYGKAAYVESARKIVETTRHIAKQLEQIPGIKIVGVPEVSVVAFTSDKFNIYGLSETLQKKGWTLNVLQFPSSVHLCITKLHTEPGVAAKFIRDVADVADSFVKDPKSSETSNAAMYGAAASLPDRSLVSDTVGTFLDALYVIPQQPTTSNGHAAHALME